MFSVYSYTRLSYYNYGMALTILGELLQRVAADPRKQPQSYRVVLIATSHYRYTHTPPKQP
jgi:hypothetical protein